MNDREELIGKLNGFQTVKIQTITANRRFTLDEVLSATEYKRLADFITEQTRLARMVGQYQAADKLYSYLTTMWLFKSDKTPEIQKKHLPQVADDMLKACEAFMNDNNAAYKAYLTQLAPKPEKGPEHE